LTRFHTIHKQVSFYTGKGSSFQSHSVLENIEKMMTGFYYP